MNLSRTLLLSTLLTPSLSAQVFTTPGQPRGRASGQTDQFSSELNPALGLVLDLLADQTQSDGDGEDGLDLTLRALELSANAWVDPSAWAYAVLVGDEEEFSLEEAAVHYVGFEGNTTLRAGRFFVDFGKQMQAHVHDLSYPERPAVLRAYLGNELSGTGVEVDHWWATSDDSALRASLGVFDSLLGGHAHAHADTGLESSAEAFVADRKDVDELSFTARVTGFSDVGESGVFQWGLSARHVPDYGLQLDGSGFARDGLSNTVLGLDLTWGTSDETGLRGWTVGTEALLFTGDIGATVDDGGTPGDPTDDRFDVVDDDALGAYLWVERELDQTDSAGCLVSTFEHPDAGAPRDTEWTVYWSRSWTEFRRLRLALSYYDAEEGDDSTSLLVQFTNFLGPHAHGVNW